MRADIPKRYVERLAQMPPEEQRRFLSRCTPADVLTWDAMFECWAHEAQVEPDRIGWRCWLMLAGRGFGKTRAGAEWIHRVAAGIPSRRVALVGATIEEARSIMVEGRSGLLSVARRLRSRVNWEPSRGRLTWPNGSVAQLYSGESPDGLRGAETHYAWADELAKWRCPDEAWANLDLGLRAGHQPRALVTTTPRSIELIDRLRKRPSTIVTGGKTDENINLPAAFVEAMIVTYGGSRLGRQELDGEYLAEAEGSLFPRAMMEKARVREAPDAFDKIVVGVDPPAGVSTSSGEARGGDACGIVVAGRADGKCYVLADCSVAGLAPEGWAAVVAEAARAWNACLVVAEVNQGGAMVASVLKAADADLPVRMVHASKGKSARAEPVATRMAVGKAYLAGTFPALEAELSGLGIGGRYDGPGRSPDRADACVWALTELGETKSGVPRVRML